jgi:CBS domain-containing protein
LKGKGSEVYSVPPSSTVQKALELMADKEIGAVLVMEADKIKGIFSERDYARRGILMGCSADSPVEKLMTCALVYIGADQTLEDCMAMMTDKHIRHLPVVEQGKLMGIISIGDVVKAMISDQERKIKNMEDYIEGRGYTR